MARINPDQLDAALKRGLLPVYLICGDEPLLVQEAGDRVRMAARQAGFSERELYHADTGFDWGQILMSANSMGLFAERKLLEVRLRSTKPGDGATEMLKHWCKSPADDRILLLIAPKLDRSAQKSGWVKSIEAAGAVVPVWPISEQQLPRWLMQRMQQAGIKADRAAMELLASRVEGNLLAATQEIEKLKLISDGSVLDAATMASAVADSARYDVFTLVDKALAGKARSATLTLQGLRSEGIDATLVLWAISREIRTLDNLQHAIRQGQALEAIARQHGIFDFRLPLIRHALQRLPSSELRVLIRLCAQVDRSIKGMAGDNPWRVLLEICLRLSGTAYLDDRCLTASLAPRS